MKIACGIARRSFIQSGATDGAPKGFVYKDLLLLGSLHKKHSL
jgi:hypothetical protein